MSKLDLDSDKFGSTNVSEVGKVVSQKSGCSIKRRLLSVDLFRIWQILWDKKYYALMAYVICFIFSILGYLLFSESRLSNKWTAITSVVYNKPSTSYNFKLNNITTVVQLMKTSKLCENVLNSMNMPASKSDVRNMLKNVLVETSRSKPNIIDISVNYYSEVDATSLSEQFAKELINSYNKHLNDTINAMNLENNRKLENLKSNLDDMQKSIRKFQTKKEGLNIGDTLDKFKDDVIENNKKMDETRDKLDGVISKMEILKEKLSGYSDESFARELILQIKKSETDLMALRETYTDKHHKVISLLNQINSMKRSINYDDGQAEEGKKKSSFSESMSYDLFSELNNELIRCEIEHKLLSSTLKKLEEKEKILEANYDRLSGSKNEYMSLIEKRQLLSARIEKLTKDMDELESQKNSGIPDIYIIESVATLELFNKVKHVIAIFFINLLVFVIYVSSILGWYVFPMRIISSREFNLCYGIEDIGEIGRLDGFDHSLSIASLQKIYRRIHSLKGDLKNMLEINTMEDFDLDRITSRFAMLAEMHGLKRGSIHLLSRSESDENAVYDHYKFEDGTEIDNLVSIGGRMYFMHLSSVCLNVNELRNLKLAIEKLNDKYDYLALTMNYKSLHNTEIIVQLEKIVRNVYICCSYNETKKCKLESFLNEVKMNNDSRIGGILLNVPKKYFYFNL